MVYPPRVTDGPIRNELGEHMEFMTSRAKRASYDSCFLLAELECRSMTSFGCLGDVPDLAEIADDEDFTNFFY